MKDCFELFAGQSVAASELHEVNISPVRRASARNDTTGTVGAPMAFVPHTKVTDGTELCRRLLRTISTVEPHRSSASRPPRYATWQVPTVASSNHIPTADCSTTVCKSRTSRLPASLQRFSNRPPTVLYLPANICPIVLPLRSNRSPAAV